VQEPGRYRTYVAIADPREGAGLVGRRLPDVERAFKERGLVGRLLEADGTNDQSALAAAAVNEGARFLVAVGGDGAVNAVVNGACAAATEPIVLGVVPCGAGSDLLRCFGMPDDVEGAIEHLTGPSTYPLDLMRVTCSGGRAARLACNVVEVGFGGEMARRIGDPVTATNLRRFRAFWGAFARSRPTSVEVRTDGRSFMGRAYNLVVGNGQFTSRGLRLSPRSFPGDGVLEVLAFVGPRSDAYRLLPRIYRHGAHVPDPHIEELRAKTSVRIEATRPLAVVGDGIALGTTPLVVDVVPGRIHLKV